VYISAARVSNNSSILDYVATNDASSKYSYTFRKTFTPFSLSEKGLCDLGVSDFRAPTPTDRSDLSTVTTDRLGKDTRYR